MYTYPTQTFSLPALEGISQKSVDAHIGLYQGYVKNLNAINTLIEDLMKDSEKNAHAVSELVRRRSFEFDGMRLHELYFSQLEGASDKGLTFSQEMPQLGAALAAQFGSAENAMMQLKQVGMMRGPGWSILYFDPEAGQFHIGFSGEQHQGHFVTLPIMIALDVWEHAFIIDYGAQGKGKYIDAFMKNLNMSVVEKRFTQAQN